jgi:hypothetical protein
MKLSSAYYSQRLNGQWTVARTMHHAVEHVLVMQEHWPALAVDASYTLPLTSTKALLHKELLNKRSIASV